MSKFNFERVIKNITAIKRDLPRLLANDAQNYWLDTFRNQGFDGQAWREVQRRTPGTDAYKYPAHKGLSRRTKPINVMTGRLRRAVSNVARTASIRYSKYDFVVRMRINRSSVPYAGYVNDGTDNMVARPFMKGSATLSKRHRRIIETYIAKAWQA